MPDATGALISSGVHRWSEAEIFDTPFEKLAELISPVSAVRSDDTVVLVSAGDHAQQLDALLEKAPQVAVIVSRGAIELKRRQPSIRGVISLRPVSAALVSRLPNLRFLKVVGVPLEDGVQAQLPQGLERLSGEPVVFETLKMLPRLAHLETFVRSQRIDALSEMPQLRVLRLESLRGMSGARVFGELINLEELSLDRVTFPNLTALSNCQRLTHLSLATSGTIDGIEALPAVSRLHLRGKNCPPLRPLSRVGKLEELVIKTVAVPPDLDVVRGLRQLKVLRLWYGTPESLTRIKSAAFFSELEGLEVLDGRGCFTIEDRDLAPLIRLKHLKYLSFQGDYPASAVRRLREGLPDCQIDLSVGPVAAEVKSERMHLLRVSNEDGTWSVFQDLSVSLGYRNNHEVEDVVRVELRRIAPEVEGRVEFDSEADAFAAYAPSREDMEQLARVVEAVRVRPPGKGGVAG